MRPVFPYYGSKTGLARSIVAALPPHRVYLEPYAGSAAVLLAKAPATHEVLNDRNSALVTFFRVLRDRPHDLEDVLRLTPYARDEYLACRLDEPGLDELEVARRFFVRSNQSVGGIVESRTTWSTSVVSGASRARTTASRIDRLQAVADRLLGVIVDNRDALAAIDLYGSSADAVIYADPPYLAETRAGPGGYHHDAPDADHHCRLAASLSASPAFVVLSGYPSALYDELYAGWHRIEIDTIHRGGRSMKATRREVLFCNQRPNDGRLPILEGAS